VTSFAALPIFPLSDAVRIPRLCVFERRYRQIAKKALAGGSYNIVLPGTNRSRIGYEQPPSATRPDCSAEGEMLCALFRFAPREPDAARTPHSAPPSRFVDMGEKLRKIKNESKILRI